MGPTTIPSQSAETIKIPTAQYEFGANFMDPKVGCHHHIYFSRFLLIIVTFGNYLPATLNENLEEFMGFPQLMLVGRY